MKINAWMAGYLVVTALLLGGSGFYFFQGRSAYQEKFQGWDDLRGKIAALEKEGVYPDKKNEDSLAETVKVYKGEVTALFSGLERFQKPLNTQLLDTDFTNRVLRDKLAAFNQLATEKSLKIETAEEFYLGFERYKSEFASKEMVPLLNYQLEAVEHILKTLAESGAKSLKEVIREPLPGETAAGAAPVTEGKAAAVPPIQSAQKFPVQIRFVSDHRAFLEFVNRIANDKSFFLVLRALRVDNSNPDGPAFGADGGEDPSRVVWKNAAGVEATDEIMGAKGKGTLPEADYVKAMEAEGWIRQRQDARIIFGQETLEVVAVIDVVRFTPPDQVPDPAPAAPKGKTTGKSKNSGN